MIDYKKLVEAGVHFGHKTSRWHPKMRPYIWGVKSNTHLIDISKTAFLLERAAKFVKEAAKTGKCILFVGTKKSASPLVQATAEKHGMPYVSHRWIGGTLSNFEQVKKAVTRLLHLREVIEKSTDRYTKKEISMIQKEIGRLERNVGGLLDLTFPPAAVIVVDAKKERSAVREALMSGIPVISLVDTNTDPTGISYIIPTNDDSPRAIELVLNYLADHITQGIEAKDAEDKAKKAAEKVAKELAAKEKVDKAEAKPAVKKADVADNKEDATAKKAPAKKAAPVKKTTVKKTAPKKEEAK